MGDFSGHLPHPPDTLGAVFPAVSHAAQIHGHRRIESGGSPRYGGLHGAPTTPAQHLGGSLSCCQPCRSDSWP